MTVYDHMTSAMQQVRELIYTWQVSWEYDEKLSVIEGPKYPRTQRTQHFSGESEKWRKMLRKAHISPQNYH